IPNRYQRPPSSHRLSHFKAKRPERKATTAPSRLRSATELRSVVPLTGADRISRITSRATTGGVKTTAKAKLNASARDLATPSNMPVEIDPPEPQKPTKAQRG